MARFREGTGTGLFVALGSLTIYAVLAWILASLLWVALSIYAVVEMVGDGRPSPLSVLMIVVLLVGGLVTLGAVGVGFVGKSLTPRKRDGR
ncbi:MAG: hypothetical protein ACRDG8_10240 [Actinomycetota bacterium]